ncbi:MAG: HlyD family efflux transporter periplasmic adaptor subunit [Betaproteobacteria bacterium]|nr:HlyD family efflux transporter periplasmic adaptor subunit [Betaproteobacteria bacterium]
MSPQKPKLIIDPAPEAKARTLLWAIVCAIVVAVVWAALAELDEVAVGDGRVTSATKDLVIQSLEGGILAELAVREGDEVEAGQTLVVLDPVQARSSAGEAQERIMALQANAARVQAEIDDRKEINFPPEILRNTLAIERERQLFIANRRAFAENVANLRMQLRLAEDELKIAQPLLFTGAATEVEVLRLRQKVAEISTRLTATQNEYYVGLRTEYVKIMDEMAPLLRIFEGRTDQLKRTTITAPSRGIVKDIRISTIGGVLVPGGVLMEIVPLGDQLLIETHINPRDIAFIRPGQEATVKISAYDSSVYGSLPATVERISPDTIEDPVDRRQHYYRVYVLTQYAYLETKNGKRHAIIPGMVASTEIRTGRKTVFDYLIKPLNRAREALRER